MTEEMTWWGVSIKDLPREELERAFVDVYKKLQTFYEPQAIHERAVGKVTLMRQK